ncbi:hypothetical protein LINPERHAP2_LOCUS10935 [Linum perenne]
MGLEKRST